MKIVLIRHGKPAFDFRQLTQPNNIRKLLEQYNQAKIEPDSRPNHETKTIAQSCNYIVCSELPRSIESARLLEVGPINESSPIFNEADLPYTNWIFPPLPAGFWSIIFRYAWFKGYANNCE